jgi:hypothetical protein
VEQETGSPPPFPIESGSGHEQDPCVPVHKGLGVHTQPERLDPVFASPEGKPRSEGGLGVRPAHLLPFLFPGQKRRGLPVGEAEGLSVSEACLCNIEHFLGGSQGFPGLRTQQNRVRDEQKEDRKKGQEDKGEQKDTPAGIELLVTEGFHWLLSSGHGHGHAHGHEARVLGRMRVNTVTITSDIARERQRPKQSPGFVLGCK